jgi:hypothetical protein
MLLLLPAPALASPATDVLMLRLATAVACGPVAGAAAAAEAAAEVLPAWDMATGALLVLPSRDILGDLEADAEAARVTVEEGSAGGAFPTAVPAAAAVLAVLLLLRGLLPEPPLPLPLPTSAALAELSAPAPAAASSDRSKATILTHRSPWQSLAASSVLPGPLCSACCSVTLPGSRHSRLSCAAWDSHSCCMRCSTCGRQKSRQAWDY